QPGAEIRIVDDEVIQALVEILAVRAAGVVELATDEANVTNDVLHHVDVGAGLHRVRALGIGQRIGELRATLIRKRGALEEFRNSKSETVGDEGLRRSAVD